MQIVGFFWFWKNTLKFSFIAWNPTALLLFFPFFSINGMVLETRKRREHLSNDDLMKNKALLENFAKGNAQYLEQQQQTQNGENGEVSDRIQPNL